MSHRITLIITNDNINISVDIPHFYENNFLVIPTHDDVWETQMIENLCKNKNSFDKILDTFFKEVYEEDLQNGDFEDINNQTNTFENLYILEITEKLKISNFFIIHYSEVGFDSYENYIRFENKEYIGEGKSWATFFETGISTQNYWRFDSCCKRYFEGLDK